jgi:hypothetical protein
MRPLPVREALRMRRGAFHFRRRWWNGSEPSSFVLEIGAITASILHSHLYSAQCTSARGRQQDMKDGSVRNASRYPEASTMSFDN